ncbi:MAG: hypothetical protein AB1540_02375 [Bdellovibrionota bacterium]
MKMRSSGSLANMLCIAVVSALIGCSSEEKPGNSKGGVSGGSPSSAPAQQQQGASGAGGNPANTTINCQTHPELQICQKTEEVEGLGQMAAASAAAFRSFHILEAPPQSQEDLNREREIIKAERTLRKTLAEYRFHPPVSGVDRGLYLEALKNLSSISSKDELRNRGMTDIWWSESEDEEDMNEFGNFNISLRASAEDLLDHFSDQPRRNFRKEVERRKLLDEVRELERVISTSLAFVEHGEVELEEYRETLKSLSELTTDEWVRGRFFRTIYVHPCEFSWDRSLYNLAKCINREVFSPGRVAIGVGSTKEEILERFADQTKASQSGVSSESHSRRINESTALYWETEIYRIWGYRVSKETGLSYKDYLKALDQLREVLWGYSNVRDKGFESIIIGKYFSNTDAGFSIVIDAKTSTMAIREFLERQPDADYPALVALRIEREKKRQAAKK